MAASKMSSAESISAGSEDASVEFCVPCKSEGKRNVAKGFCLNCSEYLCPICYDGHKKPKPCRDHALLTISDMPQNSFSIRAKPVSQRCTLTCPNHNEKVVEFYCNIHEKSVCGTCAYTDHHSCNAEKISKIAQSDRMTSEIATIENTMAKLETDLEKFIDAIGSDIEGTTESNDKAVKKMREFKGNVLAHFDKEEGKLLQEAEKLRKGKVKYLLSVQKDCQSLKSDLTKQKQILRKHENNACDTVVITKQTFPIVSDMWERFQCLNINISAPLNTFKPNMTLTLKPIGSFDKIDKKNEQLTGKLYWKKDIDVKMQEDKKFCWITGITMLSPDKLLLADRYNECVKYVDTSTSTIISRFRLPDRPWDITTLPQHQAAVTIPNKKQIEILATSTFLSSVRTLAVNGACQGVDYFRAKLIVSFECKVEMMDIHGERLFVIDDLNRKLKVTRRLNLKYVTATTEEHREVIYVSDMNTTIKLTVAENDLLTSTLNDMIKPRGLAITSDGQLLICNEINNKIFLVNPESQMVIGKSSEIKYPYSITACDENDAVYVGCHLSDSLKIFGLK